MLKLLQFWSELFSALALESGDSGIVLADTPACERRRLRCENTGDSGLGILGRRCQV